MTSSPTKYTDDINTTNHSPIAIIGKKSIGESDNKATPKDSNSEQDGNKVANSTNESSENTPTDGLPGSEAEGQPYSVFSRNQKRFIVVMIAAGGFFSPLSATIYFPALNTLSREFNVSSTLINLTLTSYLIFQGLAPTLIGDFADSAGRRPAYTVGFIIYISACIGLAVQSSYPALLVLRCLQSTGSSGTIALGYGVVADIADAFERGSYMGWVTSGIMVATAVGPLLGGILSQYLGWRSIFWFLTISASTFLVPFLIFFPETGRNVVGDGSERPQGWNMSLLNYLEVRKRENLTSDREKNPSSTRSATTTVGQKNARKLRWPNPLNALRLIFEKDVGLLLFSNSLVYTAFYTVIASMPYLFKDIYGFNDLQIGLAFLPFEFGSIIGPIFIGKLMDWNFARIAKKNGFSREKRKPEDLKDFPLELARIQVAIPLLLIGDAVLLVHGWVLHVETHLAVPLVLQCLLGAFMVSGFNVMSVLLVDLYPLSPSTATAANNLVRCLMGAGGTAIIIEMIDTLGRGWCFTLVALVLLASTPILVILMYKGPRWRNVRLSLAEERQAQKK